MLLDLQEFPKTWQEGCGKERGMEREIQRGFLNHQPMEIEELSQQESPILESERSWQMPGRQVVIRRLISGGDVPGQTMAQASYDERDGRRW
jgi:hypothetical protein